MREKWQLLKLWHPSFTHAVKNQNTTGHGPVDFAKSLAQAGKRPPHLDLDLTSAMLE
jgi:hypothetical protein